jgi:hypothetical protein
VINPAVTITKRDRVLILAIVALAIIGSIVVGALALRAATASPVQLSVTHAGPRQVEEQTEKGVLRDYSAAWKAYTTALSQNSPAALAELWVGFARQDAMDAIAAQQRSGVSLRYVDRGHNLDAVFYSQEGSALELHDTAEMQRQVLDGGSVIASDNVTAHYIVVMTPTSDHWQVRVLQAVPNF